MDVEIEKRKQTSNSRRTFWPYLYIGITLALTWSFTGFIFNNPENRLEMFVLAMLIPAPVALVISALQHRSLKHLVSPVVGRFRALIYLFSLLYPLVFIGVCGLTAWITQLARFHSERLSSLTDLPGPGEILIGLILIFGEEYGWRGYLLPELARQRGQLAATIVVGIVWAMFHAPLMYGLAKFMQIGNPILLCGVQAMAVFVLSFPFAYTFLKTGSIIPPIIFHLTWNIYNPIVLGSLYHGDPGIFDGNLLVINGETVMGILLGSLFVFWFVRNRSRITRQAEIAILS